MFRAKGNKIFIECGLSNQFSDIGEGEVASIVNSVTTLWCFFKMIGVYPGYSGGHHAEIEVISNGMRCSGLAFYASNLLLDLFETGLDFPACAIGFSDLLNGGAIGVIGSGSIGISSFL